MAVFKGNTKRARPKPAKTYIGKILTRLITLFLIRDLESGKNGLTTAGMSKARTMMKIAGTVLLKNSDVETTFSHIIASLRSGKLDGIAGAKSYSYVTSVADYNTVDENDIK